MLSTAFLAGQRIPVINLVSFYHSLINPTLSCSVVVFWQFCAAILIVLGLIVI